MESAHVSVGVQGNEKHAQYRKSIAKVLASQRKYSWVRLYLLRKKKNQFD